MKLSTRSRFGLRFLLELGLNYVKRKPVYLREISQREEISEKYLSQLALLLKSAGLISSIRGVHGGYILNKEPREIRLLEIIQTLEGDLSLVPCVNDSTYCQRVAICATREVWLKMGKAFKEALGSLTLQDLMAIQEGKLQGNVYYQI